MAEAAVVASEAENGDLPDILADYEAPPENAPKDIVAGRYRILLNQPLPEFSRTLATAYAIEDIERQHEDAYALVCANNMPYRMKGIEALKSENHPALPQCYAAAPTPLSNPAETRMVLIVEKPKGQRLSDLVRTTGPLSERVIIEKIIRPLHEALSALSKHKINHGCINPDTLYFGTELKVTEPISEPSGYSQHFYYDPPERLLASASSKGSGSPAADAYAIGVLALFLSMGSLPVGSLNRQQFEEHILKLGCYHAFTQQIDPNDALLDLLRGTLNDNPVERWGTEQLDAWLEGKRFHLIMPSIPRDSSRPFHFNGEDYFNYRSLAHSIYRHWQTAKTQLSPSKLVRWMELNANKSDAADIMARVLRINTDNAQAEDDRNLTDEEVMKVIAVLDPFGPMRYKDASVNIDGIGKALAEAFREKNNSMRQYLVTLLESGLPAFLTDVLEKTNSGTDNNNNLWRLQNLRPILQLKGLGFGVERILYSLNPSLTCQSLLIQRYHPVSLQDTLTLLDRLAKDNMKRQSLIDTHLAAFLTNKLEITKELRIFELAAHPDLFLDARLVMLKLLCMAQQKIGNPPLKGLAAWTAMMILPLAGKLHQKSSRELIIKEIRKATATGILQNIVTILFKDKIFADDKREYERAKTLYKYYHESIASLEDNTRLKRKAIEQGRAISVTLGYLMLGAMIYSSLDPYLRF